MNIRHNNSPAFGTALGIDKRLKGKIKREELLQFIEVKNQFEQRTINKPGTLVIAGTDGSLIEKIEYRPAGGKPISNSLKTDAPKFGMKVNSLVQSLCKQLDSLLKQDKENEKINGLFI